MEKKTWEPADGDDRRKSARERKEIEEEEKTGCMDNIMAWTEKHLEDIHRSTRSKEMPINSSHIDYGR